MTDKSKPPNVVVVMVDDLAYGDLSAHGNPYTETAHLDRLHDESVRFTRCCSGPLCTPARAALYTGRHPYRTRAYDTYLGRSNLDADEVTLAHLFAQEGYRTGLFGKWHLGDSAPNDPQSMGFNEALYHTGGGLRQPSNIYGRNSYFDPELIYNGERVVREGYCTDIFTEAACTFIRESEGPFFCSLAFNAVHSPFEIVEEWAEPFRKQGLPEVWCRVYGMLQNLDANMGLLLQCLYANQLRSNTIIYFTSDHGPCGSANHEGVPRHNCNLRGIKGSLYEGGIKVPAFWSGPDFVNCEHDLVCNPIDVLPTLLDVCGIQLPNTHPVIDGVSLRPVIERREVSSIESRRLCMQWHRGDRPVFGENAICIEKRFKWYSLHPGVEELYDLSVDPHETRNIIDTSPEIAESLRETYEVWFAHVCGEHHLLNTELAVGVPIVIPTSGAAVYLTWQDWKPYSGEEGFSVQNPGSWLLNLSQAGSYRVVVDLAPSTVTESLILGFGGMQRTITVPEQVETLCVDLQLPALVGHLDCYFVSDSKRLGCQSLSLRYLGNTAS